MEYNYPILVLILIILVTSCPGIIDECNSNGNCNTNTGVCECVDGYGGDSCES